METKNKKDFKTVDFMRKVREELSVLYKTDKDRYFKEIKKAMSDFGAKRKAASNPNYAKTIFKS